MSQIIAPQILESKAEYAENLLTEVSNYDSSITFTVVTAGSATATISIEQHFSGISSLKIDINDSTEDVTISNTVESFTAPVDAYYSFSLAFYDTSVNPNPSGVFMLIKTFKNGSAYNDYSVATDAADNTYFELNQWNTFSQMIFLNAGDVLSWKYFFGAGWNSLSNPIFYIDRLQISVSDKDLGICPLYQPAPLDVYEGSATLDFGSITAGNYADLTITVMGAKDKDYVAKGIPIASQVLGAIFDAFVSATNTVTVRCYNSTGSSINPASGIFNAKIIR